MSTHSATTLRPETLLKLWLYTKQESKFSAYGLPDKQSKPIALPMPYLWEVNSRPESDHRPYSAGSTELSPLNIIDDERPVDWVLAGNGALIDEF